MLKKAIALKKVYQVKMTIVVPAEFALIKGNNMELHITSLEEAVIEPKETLTTKEETLTYQAQDSDESEDSTSK